MKKGTKDNKRREKGRNVRRKDVKEQNDKGKRGKEYQSKANTN